MRVLVTGAMNPVGAAVCRALAADGHTVRAFGVPPGEDPFHHPNVEVYPGWVEVGGSVEPVAAECHALVHCANLDVPGKDREAHAVRIEKGTMYARYAAERELVAAFVALFPADAGRAYGKTLQAAQAYVKATRPLVPHHVLAVTSPDDAVEQVRAALAKTAVVPA